MDKISIIAPCYNEEKAIPAYFEEVQTVRQQMPNVQFELIFVNDGSMDRTLEILRDLAERYEGVRYISFSRNFGKEAAMLAGLEHATGDFVTIMDVDLQDPPGLLPEMYEILKEGEYDCVATRSVSRRGYSWLRKISTKCYYWMINKLSKTEIVEGARDFRLMTRQMVNAVLELKEYNRYSKGIFSWVGFKTKWITYETTERVAGKSRWSFLALCGYAIESIVGFSTAPLTIAALMGILFCLVAFVFIIVIVVKTLIFGDPVTGWPSLACIIFLVGGVQLFCLGIVGQYLAKMYLEIKKRPSYIIKETEKDRCKK